MSLVGGGIPFVMTAKLKAALRARGLTDEAIAQMTPGDAHKLLMTDEERAARAIVKLRRRVLAAGFNPIPLAGKLPVLKAWQKHDGVSDLEISTWSTRYPLATNTGILTATAPALDIDILDPDAAAAVEALVKARFEDGATVPVRFGHFPKRAILFRTDVPFAKIVVSLATADDPEGLKGQRLEFLADGQQIVIAGDHPDTGKPYTWHGVAPGGIKRKDLSLITEAQAKALVADAVELLITLHGYQLPVRKAKAKATTTGTAGAGKLNGAGHGLFGAPADWNCDYSNHNEVCAMAMKLLLTGMADASVVNFLRAQIEALEDVDPARQARRLHEVPAMVTSARAKIGAPAASQPQTQPKTKTKAGQGQWPDPEPLEAGLLEVIPFDPDALLPESIRPWVTDMAEQMQCPVDYLGTTAMVGLGSTLGRRIAVRPTRSGEWFEVPNLWGIVAGPPGMMKSPAMNAALKPLRRLEERAQEQGQFFRAAYERAAKIYKRREAAAEAMIAKALKNDPNAEAPEVQINTLPPVLRLPRKYILINSTYEKIGEHASHNPLGFLIHRDEIMSLLRYLAQEDHSEARGFYLEAWAGNTSYDFSRIGRGEILVPHLSFSLIGSTQPGVLSAFVAESSRDESNDGMLQRFGMMIWPDSAEEFEFIDRAVDSSARNTAYAAFDRLDQLDVDDAGAQRSTNFDLPWLPFADDAYQAFKAWRIRFENELRSEKIGSPALEAHLAKHRKLIPVLALIRHLADGGAGPVTLHALESAFAWARYLESHARRIYGSIGDAEARAAKAIAARIKGGDLSAPFLAREISASTGWV